MDLSSRTISASSPGVPSRAKPGAFTLSRSQRSVTQTAHTATGRDILVAHTQQVIQNITLAVLHHSTCGTVRIRSSPLKPWCISPRPISPFRGMLVRAVVVLQQGRGLVIHAQNHRATITTVTAVRAAQGLNFSRRTETQPLPPRPPDTCKTTRSTNSATGSPYLGKYSLRHRTAHTNHAADAAAGATGLGAPHRGAQHGRPRHSRS